MMLWAFQLLVIYAALGSRHANTADAFLAITITHTYCETLSSGVIPCPFFSHGSRDTSKYADNDGGMSKIEASGVKRFTVGYDKLCKNCPTRLQPRVDTLTEMILGLTDEERDELMQNVANRLVEEQNQSEKEGKKVVSSMDLYEFQTSSVAVKPEQQKPKRKKSPQPASATIRKEADKCKAARKIEKARLKFQSNKQNAARASRLLVITNALLSPHSQHAKDLQIGPADNGWYHEIDILMQLSRADLKMESLKLKAQKTKCESKIAKQRMKAYGASMAVANVNKRKASVAIKQTSKVGANQLQLLH